MPAVSTPEPLPPFPDGWYFVARADELAPGTVLTRRLAGEDVVLFRTARGALAALRPHCPHLGAHLGHGGRVDGEALRCPMHGFCFDAAGRCTRTGYGTRPPPTAIAGTRHVRERDGLVLVWHATPARAPTWELPARPLAGASRLRTHTFACAGHPQETSENAVDLGHLYQVHAFTDVTMTAPLAVDGPQLTSRFAFTRRAPIAGRALALRVHYAAHVHGLGFSFVDVEVPALGLRTHQYVLATPTDAGRLALTIALRAAPPTRLAVPAGRALLAELAASAIMRAYVREVANDLVIWRHKRYVAQPALAQGDGPIGAYRRWARQFYPPARAAAAMTP